MKQPEGFDDGSGRVCRLKKAIYGLCQAARQFYVRLDDILHTIGFTRLSADWAIWTAPNGAFLACHVDDMAVAGTQEQLSEIKSTIQSYLELKDLGELRSYLDISIEDSESVFYLSQIDYIDKTL